MKLKISFSSWFGFLFFLLPATKTYFVQLNPLLDNLFDICGIFACVILFFTALNQKKIRKYIPKDVWLMILFILIYLISTILNFYDQLVGALSESARILIVPLYLVIEGYYGEIKFNNALKKLHHFFIVLLMIDNAVSLLKVIGILSLGEGIQYSLFGLDNYASFSIIPMLTVIFTYSYTKKSKMPLIDLITYGICLLTKLLTGAVTASLALLVMGFITLIIINIKNLKQLFSPKIVLGLIIFFIIGVVVFKIQYLLEPILTALGRDVTLSYRTVIWKKTIKCIPKSILWGYGKTSDDEFKTIVGFSLIWDQQANHPHNYFLAILFETGIIGSYMYLKLLLNGFKKIYIMPNRRIVAALLGGVSAFMILGIADDYIMQPYFFILLTVILLQSKIKLPLKQNESLLQKKINC